MIALSAKVKFNFKGQYQIYSVLSLTLNRKNILLYGE